MVGSGSPKPVGSGDEASRDCSRGRTVTSRRPRSRRDASSSWSSGRREGEVLELRFEVGQVLPAGAQDLGAFVKTLETLRMSVPERAGAKVSKPTRIEDPEDEIYASVTTIRLRG